MLAVLRGYARPFAASVLFGVANQGSGIAAAALGAHVVALALSGEPADRLWPLVWLLAGLVLARSAATWGEAWISHELAFRILAEIRHWLYWAFSRMAPGRLLGRRSGDLVARAMADSEAMEMFYAHTLIYLVVAAVLTPVALGALALLHPLLALAVLPVLLAACTVPFALRSRNAAQGRALRERTAEVNTEVVDAVSGLREIVAFGQGRRRGARLAERTAALARAQAVQGRRAGTEMALVNTLVSLGVVAAAVAGAYLVDGGALPVVRYPVAVVLAANVFAPVVTLFNATKVWGVTSAGAQRVFDLLEEPAAVPDEGTVDPPCVTPRIEFDGVRFAYAPGGPEALRGVRFTVEPGETVALVGHSGAGKSTCAHLLLRFFDPTAGAVRIGGIDLRDLPQRRLYELVAHVPQDVFLFHDAVVDNVTLGRPDATEAEVAAALEDAQAAGFVAALPDGPRTPVGERGARLSGGERQRLALARALLRDAPILVLDEAVSMLDAVSEREVQRAIARTRSGRTCLVIAHRLSTILAADRIVVLEAGRVVGTGTHEQLLAACPAYARLLAL
jgi:ABC-type multidrug transport system fused ATPase/permease subunit